MIKIYFQIFILRILRIREGGLVDFWIHMYTPPPSKCMEINQRDPLKQMSIRNFSSAFTILISGYILSVLVFVLEIFIRKTHLLCSIPELRKAQGRHIVLRTDRY